MEATARKMESDTLGKLGEALAKAQGEMDPAAKDSENPHFRSKYADLASIREAIRKPLSNNGLAFFQRLASDVSGVTVETTLIHASGEFIRDFFWVPVLKQTAQEFGSASTYARRYSLAALVGVVADVDDDANTATPSGPSAKRGPDPIPKAAARKNGNGNGGRIIDVQKGEDEKEALFRKQLSLMTVDQLREKVIEAEGYISKTKDSDPSKPAMLLKMSRFQIELDARRKPSDADAPGGA